MLSFITELKLRNQPLFFFGLVCLFLAIGFLLLTKLSNTQVYGVNAWLKPAKFAFSTFLFAWSMAWYCQYLVNFRIQFFNWTVILLLGFEIVYIAFMAGKGEVSHYNQRTPLFAAMFSLMALAATLITLYTAYIGLLFFIQAFPGLPRYYLWAIRLGILIFVVFAFEGFIMGAKLSHSVGLVNDNSNWFILGWSKTAGDLRVSHFIGMHALQTLPLLSFYFLKNTKLTILASVFYAMLAIITLIQALQGKPLFAEKSVKNELIK